MAKKSSDCADEAAGKNEAIAKKTRRDKSDLGEHFVAPDGGWAWLVCIAAGVSNLFIYPTLHQFGLIFRERLALLGLSSSEVTTIINTNPAISACTGLLNGPMFRRYTFRQVGLAGSICIFGGLVLTAFCNTFVSYMLFYSVLYGFGVGISVSASSLAINTYFKDKRRQAAGFSWTITGIGPIFLPHLVTLLLSVYGVQGTVLIFAALSLHAFVCALIYQPVQYHAPVPSDVSVEDTTQPAIDFCTNCDMHQRQNRGLFSSQYLYQDDDPQNPGYEITAPGTPMMARANDGWFGSRQSLTSGKTRFRTVSSSGDAILEESENNIKKEEFFKPNNFNREREEILRHSTSKGNLQTSFSSAKRGCRCTCAEKKNLLEGFQSPLACPASDSTPPLANATFLQKVVTFFDLDLLRDFTFVNLVAGLTIINFGELNFSILTPFILNDFGFETSQITLTMSVLATVDITMRFFLPFFIAKISWDNRVFFLIGVVGIAVGRTVVACNRSFSVILGSFVWIGICKGVRTIFWPLIIPGYVPLKRLPAASGLQLLISGLFTLVGGPFVGLIRDRFDYSVTLHCLNCLTFLAAISWISEALIRRYCLRKTIVSTLDLAKVS